MLMFMKKFEITAFSYNEAKEKALSMGIDVAHNVTQSFKNDNPSDFDVWANDMLVKNRLADSTGTGLMVVLDAGSADTRQRPYELVNNVVEGQLSKKRVFQIKTVSGKLVAEANTKADAIRVAKNMMKTVRENMVCEQVYKVLEPKNVAFMLNYVPSVGTKLGTYVVFSN